MSCRKKNKSFKEFQELIAKTSGCYLNLTLLPQTIVLLCIPKDYTQFFVYPLQIQLRQQVFLPDTHQTPNCDYRRVHHTQLSLAGEESAVAEQERHGSCDLKCSLFVLRKDIRDKWLRESVNGGIDTQNMECVWTFASSFETRLRGVSYLVPASSQGLNYYLVSEYRAKNWSFESPSNTVISVDMSIVLIEVHLNVKL